jgi:hypothetical protein
MITRQFRQAPKANLFYCRVSSNPSFQRTRYSALRALTLTAELNR